MEEDLLGDLIEEGRQRLERRQALGSPELAQSQEDLSADPFVVVPRQPWLSWAEEKKAVPRVDPE